MFHPRNHRANHCCNRSRQIWSWFRYTESELSNKEKHVKIPSKFPPWKILHPLNGGNACGKDTSGSKPTPPANELQSIHSALLQQTERATKSDGEMLESDGKCGEKV